jgi:hypothetical protein
MANPEHLDRLRQVVDVWNAWRAENPSIRPDLSRADLYGVDLYRANLSGADLSGANLTKANLMGANLGAANLIEADLTGADLIGTNLTNVNLSGANLSGADLYGAQLVEANLSDAVLTGCRVYGVSAWNVKLSEATIQRDLIITPRREPEVTTDDLEVAQFIHLLLRNEKLQRVIDTITSKVVLILGRFSSERKMVLDALRDELRKRNYAPVVFDFEKPNDYQHSHAACSHGAVCDRRHLRRQKRAAGAAGHRPQ